jgi:hypothetical protein
MDLVSTLTMVFELIWIEDLIMDNVNVSFEIAFNFIKITRICKLVKISTRSSKIIKFIKIFSIGGINQNNMQMISNQAISTYP